MKTAAADSRGRFKDENAKRRGFDVSLTQQSDGREGSAAPRTRQNAINLMRQQYAILRGKKKKKKEEELTHRATVTWLREESGSNDAAPRKTYSS